MPTELVTDLRLADRVTSQEHALAHAIEAPETTVAVGGLQASGTKAPCIPADEEPRQLSGLESVREGRGRKEMVRSTLWFR